MPDRSDPSRSTVPVVLASILVVVLAGLALGIATRGGAAAGSHLAPGTEPLPPLPELTFAPGSQAGALSVVVALPRTRLVGSMRPAIVFSRPVVALQAADGLAELPPPARLEPSIPGRWRWLGSSAAEFAPDEAFPMATAFTVTVPRGLRALDGSTLAEDYRYGFETPRPEIYVVEPGEGSRWVTPEQVFALSVNQRVRDIARRAWIELRPGEAGAERVPLRLVRQVDVAQEEAAQRRDDRRRGWSVAPDRGLPDRRTRYELAPERPLPLDAPFALVVSSELAGEEGPLTLEAPRRFSMRTYGPLEVVETKCGFLYSEECPYGPFTLITTNEVDLASLKGRVRVEPPVEIDWEGSESTVDWKGQASISLAGAWRPGTTYRLTLAPGVTDLFGQTAPAWEGSITTSDLPPTLDTGRRVALIEQGKDASLSLRTVNLKSVRAEVWRVTPAEMARAFYETAGAQLPWAPARAPATEVLDVSSRRNATRWSPLVPSAIAAGPGDGGLFVIHLDSPEIPADERPEKGPLRRVLAQVTDLAVHAKLGPESGVAWVTSLSRGTPVEGAAVDLLASDGEPFFHGTTDRDGLVRLPAMADRVGGNVWNPELNLLVVASKEGDTGVTATGFEDAYTPWAMGMMGGWEGNDPEALGYVAAERGIYRPGDTVHFVGLARLIRVGKLVRPDAGVAMKLALLDGSGTEVAEAEAAVTSFGTFSGEFVIPKSASLGYWSLRARLAGRWGGPPPEYYGSFRVEEFRAPPFLIDMKAAAPSALAGERLSATVLGRYAFGGAMAGAPVRWTAIRSPGEVSPPGNAEFAFGQDVWWWDDDTPRPSSMQTAAGEGAIDARGNFAFDAGIAEAPGERPWSYTLEAEVVDVSRQRVADRAVVTVHPAEAYAGVRTTVRGFAEEGKPVEVELIAAAPDGARRTGLSIDLAVTRRTWKSIRKKSAGDRWEVITEPVDEPEASCRVRSAATPQNCRFTPSAGGLFLLEATLVDSAGRRQKTRTGLYVLGSGWVSWQRDGTDRIDLVPDRELYDVGDTAQVLVKSPFPGAEAIVTVERAGVMSARRLTLDGAARAIPVPIDESMVPNAFVSVVLVRGRVPTDQAVGEGADPGRPEFRIGYCELKVERKSRRLAVAITPRRAEYRPRQKVEVELAVTDANGSPARAQLSVWAVDETVLRLTAYQPPDPVEAIYPPRPLSVRTAEPLVNLVLRRWYGEKGGTAPGGGGGPEGGEIRSLFKTTVLFAPELLTGDDGRARVSFDLPDNLTSYRIVALAVGVDERFGTGAGSIRVAKPLLAIPALPRVARVGDRFEAGVVVRAEDPAPTTVEVRAEAEGGVALTEEAAKKVTLSGGRAQEVRFPFRGIHPAPATLRFRVQAGAERDAVEQKLAVVPSTTPETVAIYGDTEAERTEALALPEKVRDDVGGLTVTLASSALSSFSGAMRQLVAYPYGCAEQLASRLIPFVALRRIQRDYGLAPEGADARAEQREREARWLEAWLGLPPARAAEPGAIVEETLLSLSRLQRADGGFGYWPNSRESSPWASAWAVLALFEAKDAGYPVASKVLADGQRYLAEAVAPGTPIRTRWGSVTPDDDDRAFALWVLARTGAPRGSYYADLFARRAGLGLAARAMLADALFRAGGDAAIGRALLDELSDAVRIEAGEAFLQDTARGANADAWSADVPATATFLMLLDAHAPANPLVPMLVRWLGGERLPSGEYRSTQDAAFTLAALSELAGTREREAPDFTARVELAGKEVAEARFVGRTLEMDETSAPIGDLPQGGEATLRFGKQGPGILYYGARLTFAPLDPPTDALDRGIVLQRWLEPYGASGQARSLPAGELATLRVRVATPEERRYVALDLPVPAGFDPVDTTLATTAALPPIDTESEEEAGEEGSVGAPGRLPDWAYGEYSPFQHRELRDDRVLAFADRLPPGVWEIRFILRATTPGSFLFPAARAEEMYRPETFGRAGALEVTVTP